VRFSERSNVLRGSRIRAVNNEIVKLTAAGIDVFKFHIGQPGLPPNLDMLEEFSRELLDKPFQYSSYTASNGIEELRMAIAEDYRRYSGVSIDSSNVSVTAGSAEAILATLMSVLDEGDEVVILDPLYVAYEPLIRFLGGIPRRIVVRVEDSFVPNEEEVKASFNRKTKAVIIINPDNPTGRVLDSSFMKLITDLVRDHDSLLIYDEAYRHLYYEGSHVYALGYDMEHVVALNTFSKDPALPGWRLGYVVASEEFLKVFNRVKQYTNLNPPTPAQYLGTLYILKYKERYLRETLPIYSSRLEAMYDALRRYIPEAVVVKPRAGLFIFPKIGEMNDEEFCLNLLRTKRVALIPGSAFGEGGRGHVRLTFAAETEERIREGIRLMAEFINEQGPRPPPA